MTQNYFKIAILDNEFEAQLLESILKEHEIPHLLISYYDTAFDGLYHSTDTGKTFTKLDGVQEIHAFGFGKAARGAAYSALYLIGVVDGGRGIFRSDDTGKTWVRINDDQHQWGLLLHITGDPKKYGRVYVGTHGRGTVYGDPVEAKD